MSRNKKRADGRYAVSVYTGTVDGKRQYKYFYAGTQSEAQAAADEYRKKLKAVSDAKNAQFRHLAGAWLDNKRKTVGAAQANTLQGFVNVLDAAMGDVPVLEITEDMLTDFLFDLSVENPRTGNPSSQATILKYHQTIKAIFRYSRIRPDPAEYLEIPRGRRKHERRALTAGEQAMVREFDHRARLPAMLAMYAGLRRGELTALTWGDIGENYITVNKAYDFAAKKVKTPKTEAGVREVYILPPLREYLKTVRRGRAADPVCTSEGKALSLSAWRKLWVSYMTDLDVAYGGRVKFSPRNTAGVYTIKTFTLHELRHTYATLLHDADVDVKVAQSWLGHSDASTTLNIYTHLSEAQKMTAAARVKDYFASLDASQQILKMA